MHRTLTGTEPGLIGYWQFNEETGTTASDLTAGGNDGTLVNFAFDGNDGWRTSTAPFGAGTSAYASNFMSGTANLGTVTLSAVSDPIELFATAITASPDSLPADPGCLLSDRYWIITPYGTPGAFASVLTFIVPGWFTKNGSAAPSTYILYHRDDNSDGSWDNFTDCCFEVTATTVKFAEINPFGQLIIGSTDGSLNVPSDNLSPKEFVLYQNYPNPFNPTTNISFLVGTYGHTSLRLYDILGREVAVLVNETKPAGSYRIEWNAAGLPSGMYFCRLSAGSFTETKKLILLK
jgi:hypothetical protein